MSLVASLCLCDEPARTPGNRVEVFPVSAQLHIDALVIADRENMERNSGVGCASSGIAMFNCRGLRMSGVCDVPNGNIRNINATCCDLLRIGRPPIATHATHLFGGNEFSTAPSDSFGKLRRNDLLVACDISDTQRCAAYIGDACSVRGEANIENTWCNIGKSDGPSCEINMNNLSAQHSDCCCDCCIARVRDNTAGAFASALTSTEFFCREL